MYVNRDDFTWIKQVCDEFELDAKDFACRSKAKAKPQRREPAGSSPRTVSIG